jgi:3-keto-disaccharide hydrolase
METISRRSMLTALLATAVPLVLRADEGWISLFNGDSLRGWKTSENQHSFRVSDGQIVVDGARSHLFYTGDGHVNFKDFEFQADVMTRPGANSGIYFHTAFQQTGFPDKGFEVQVNNTYKGEGEYLENKKTGSLYGVRNIYKQLVPDNQWFQMRMVVRGKQVRVWVNGLFLVDYMEPDPPVVAPDGKGRVLSSGTFALQCHDTGSKAFFRNLYVKPLPDSTQPNDAEPQVVDDIFREIIMMSAENFAVVDYHVHLKAGFTLEDAMKESRRTGIQYGIAVNCGRGFPVTDDASAAQFLANMQGQPCYIAMQGEGREWVKMFSAEAVAKFDYVFTDAMTFTADNGKRMRIWIPEEVGVIEDKQQFMEMYVTRILSILNHEPIDIHANPTFLPASIAADYDELWTPERRAKVIEAAKRNGVAIEINNTYKIPSATFIKEAKQAGVKFSFGTNNSNKNIGRLEYSIAMVKECGLTWQDIFVPKPDGEKPVQKRGLPQQVTGL